MLVATRTSDGEKGLDPRLAAWLQRDSVHHMEVGALAPDAARELIAVTATEGSLPPACVGFVLEHCGGVALHLQQMVKAFLDSNLLFLNEDGTYELEGNLEELNLPTSLNGSIRLRLGAVRERDPDLDTLLRLAAVMGGGFTHEAVGRVWGVLAVAGALDGTIQRAVRAGFLKYLTASGNSGGSAAGQRRRSSAAGGAVGRFVFSHLRILDNVLELLLTADVRRLHTACAECLEGAVETLQLAQHNEKAGRLLQAARLHSAHSITLQTHSAGHDVVGAAARRAVECARHAEPASEQTERMEIRALLTLLGTWTMDNVEMIAAFERCAHARLLRRRVEGLARRLEFSCRCEWLNKLGGERRKQATCRCHSGEGSGRDTDNGALLADNGTTVVFIVFEGWRSGTFE